MSGPVYPSLKPYYSKPWGEWFEEVEKRKIPAIEEKVEDKTATVTLLPRKDILLYGTCPKNDVRVLCRCERCNKLLMPIAYVQHMKEKHGPDQQAQPAPVVQPGTSLLKKKYSHSKNKKKINPPPVPPPPLFQTYEAPIPASPIQAPAAISAAATATTTTSATAAATAAAVPSGAATAPTVVSSAAGESKSASAQSVHVAKSEHEVFVEATPAPPSPANGNGSNNASSKHKKSKKSSKKVKEFDPDKHCGVLEGNKGPCLRSITCSNHMIHLRKAVPGRSKDLHQLIADHKASKDKETIKSTIMSIIPKSSSSASTIMQTSTPVPVTMTTLTATTVTASKSSDIHVISQPLHISVPSTGVSIVSPQGNNEPPTSVVYMPMSPVAVVSPVQFVQLGGSLLRVASTQPVLSPPLATQPLVVTIPVQTTSAPQYPAHPKPLIMSTCSTRKIGGSFVLQNQRVDRQRNEIQVASNTRRAISNSCSIMNSHHKPNILKNSVRSGSIKIGVKRQSSEKMVNDNNKHIRLSDVNGFILHSDVSETAEAPQTNNCIHDKVTFINMK